MPKGWFMLTLFTSSDKWDQYSGLISTHAAIDALVTAKECAEALLDTVQADTVPIDGTAEGGVQIDTGDASVIYI